MMHQFKQARSLFIAFLLLVLLAFAAPACGAPQAGLPPAPVFSPLSLGVASATISGAVTGSSTTPLAGIEVTAYQEISISATETSSLESSTTTTAADGSYTFINLKAGDYTLVFTDATDTYLRAELSVPLVAENETRGGCDITLQEAVGISGTVRESGFMLGLPHIRVYAYLILPQVPPEEIDPMYLIPAAFTETDTSGSYTLRGLMPGDYRLAFIDETTKYATSYNDNAPSLASSPDITLTAYGDTATSDATLTRTPALFGLVTNSEGEALSDICVTAFVFDDLTQDWQPAETSFTDDAGAYLFTNLSDGKYRLNFTDESDIYSDLFYPDADLLVASEDIFFSQDGPHFDLDVVLRQTASLSGRVTFAEDGGEAETIVVTLYRAYLQGETVEWRTWASTSIDLSGTYSFVLPAAGYTLSFSDTSGRYLTQYFEGAVSLDAAREIVLGPGESFADGDAQMTRAATLSGTVSDSHLQAIPGVVVSLYRTQGLPDAGGYYHDFSLEASCVSASDGAWQFGGLAPGNYTVSFTTESYLSACLGSATELEQADIVVLASGDAATRTMVLMRYANVSGTIVTEQNLPLADVPISLLDAQGQRISGTLTRPDGSFAISHLVPGVYYLCLNPASAPEHKPAYETSYFDDAPEFSDAGKITLAAEQLYSLPESVLPVLGTYQNHTVSFVTDRGLAPGSQTYTYKEVVGTLPALTFPGYTFLGWFTDPAGGVQLSASYQVKADITLHARWRSNDLCILTYDPFGGSSVEPTTVISYLPIGPEKLPVPNYPGYSFDGWYTSAYSGSGDTALTKDSVVATHTVLYARWSALPQLTITFDSAGGEAVGLRQLTFGTALDQLPQPTKTGYRFLGWFDDAHAGREISDGYIPQNSMTFYARWMPVVYCTLSYNVGGGFALEAASAEQGEVFYEFPVPVRPGFEFVCWHLKAIAGPTVSLPYSLNADVTLVAEWRAEDFGSGSGTSQGGNAGGGSGGSKEVVKLQSKVTTLKALKLAGGKLKKKFNPKRLSYKLVFNKKAKAVTIHPKLSDKKAKVYIKKGRGSYKKKSSIKIALKRGKKVVVRIKVVAQNKSAYRIYKITVIRKK